MLFEKHTLSFDQKLKIIEVFVLILGFWVTLKTLHYTNENLNASIQQTNVSTEQLKSNRSFEHMRFIFEINREIFSESNKPIIADLMRKEINIPKQEAMLFLDNFEMIAQLRDAKIISDPDITNNFLGVLTRVCKSSFLVGEGRMGLVYSEGGYSGVKVLCDNFIFRR